MIFAISLMRCSGNYAQVVNGATCPLRDYLGRRSATAAADRYFHRWKLDGTIEKLNAALNQADRLQAGCNAMPSLLCVDSQSVKLAPMGSEAQGMDAHKAVNGRKRQLVVDSQGRLWVARVHAANEADDPAAVELIGTILWRCGEGLEVICGDQAYNGVFRDALAQWSIDFEKASRPELAQGFVPIAKRWVFERTISWTNFFRRLEKDYEYTISSSVSWLYLANIQPRRRTDYVTTS